MATARALETVHSPWLYSLGKPATLSGPLLGKQNLAQMDTQHVSKIGRPWFCDSSVREKPASAPNASSSTFHHSIWGGEVSGRGAAEKGGAAPPPSLPALLTPKPGLGGLPLPATVPRRRGGERILPRTPSFSHQRWHSDQQHLLKLNS